MLFIKKVSLFEAVSNKTKELDKNLAAFEFEVTVKQSLPPFFFNFCHITQLSQ